MDTARRISRRNLLKLAGTIGAGAAMASLPMISGCKSGNPSGPSNEPTPVDLKFRVFNHTQGLRGEFSQNGIMSGTTLSLSVAQLVSRFDIRDVDPNRIALRKVNFGTKIQYSNQGSVEFAVTRDPINLDIFLFNSAGTYLYDIIEFAQGFSSGLHYQLGSKKARAYRKDFDGQTGEERIWGGEFLPEIGAAGVFDQFNSVLNPSWATFSFGSIERSPTGSVGKFSYGYGNVGGLGYGLTFSDGVYGILINPNILTETKMKVAVGLGMTFETILGGAVQRLGQETYKLIAPEGVLNQAGMDAIGLIYVKV